MKISNLIELSSAFAAEVNVARDFKYRLTEKNQHIDGYLPNASSRNIIKLILETLTARDDRKLHLITASYGTGKSYLLLILAHLLGNNKSEILEEFRKKISDKDLYYNDKLSTVLEGYVGQDDSYLIVIPEYGSDDFEQSLLASLNEALKKNDINFTPTTHFSRATETIEHWKTTNNALFKLLETKLNNVTGEQFINLLKNCDISTYQDFKKLHKELIGSDFSENHGNIYQSFTETAKKISESGYKGIVILYDEFGAVLDKLINKSSVSATLKIQDFIEKVKDKENNSNIILVAASHQDPSTIQENKKENINKVIARFEKHALIVADSESEELMGKVLITKDISQKENVLQSDLIEKMVDETKNFRLYPSKDEKWIENKIVKDLYPLHPLTTFILPRLSSQFAQNNRSMFNFLSPKEIENGSFSNYILSTDIKKTNGKLSLFTPDLLLAFFKKNLSEAKSESVTAMVDAYETTIGKVTDSEVIRLMDNILILTATRSGEVKPTFEILLWAMYNKNRQDLKYLLDDLVQTEILELNPNEKTYEFPAFGSKSLTKIVQEETKKLEENSLETCNKIWEEIEPRGSFDFIEHNEIYGSNRRYQNISITNDYFLDTYMMNLKKFYSWENDYQTNGYVIYLLGKNESDINSLKEALKRYSTLSKYFVFASPKDFNIFETLQNKTQDYRGQIASSNRNDVIGNINHADKLNTQLNKTRSELSNLIKELYEPKNWIWHFDENSEPIEFKSMRSLSVGMNEYISNIFSIVPKIVDDALWFVKGSTGKQFREKALSDILMAEKDRIPLVDSNNKAASDRIVENFFKNLQLSRDTANKNKIQYGEIKLTTPKTPIHEIWQLIDKNIKLNEQTAPENIVKPLLNAPFGLSEPIIKFILTCFIRVNKDVLIITDTNRATKTHEKVPSIIEDIFKKPKDFRIRRIEMSEPEIRYRNQLNSLFKDNPASTFGEISKKFEGFIQYFTILHNTLIQTEGTSELIEFYTLLKDFKETLNENGVNREVESRTFFTETLPSTILDKTKDEFENDADNALLITEKIKEYKDFPYNKERELKFRVLQDIAKKVFDTSINSQEDFKLCIKNWFSGLRDSTRNNSIFENQFINTWVKSLRGLGGNNDIFKFYLEELVDKPIKDWDNLSYDQLTLIQTYKDYKNEIEQYTKNPLEIYQFIIRDTFSIPISECDKVEKFTHLFESWWNDLPLLSKEHRYEELCANILIETFKSSYSTKDKFLVQIPVRWKDSGVLKIVNVQWEDWTNSDIRQISTLYRQSVEIINNWKPPIEESVFYEAVANLFDIQSCKEVLDLQAKIKTTWFSSLPSRTQSAVWDEKSNESEFINALKSDDFRSLLITKLPNNWGLIAFKSWNEEVLNKYITNLALLKSNIESYRRPLFDIIKEIEKKNKDKSISTYDFRVKLKEDISKTEAFKCNAEQDELLLTDKNSGIVLKMLRNLSSETTLKSIFTSIAATLSIDEDNHYWTIEDQIKFVNEYNRCIKLIKEWKFPEDIRISDAKKKISTEIETLGLTKSQLLKVLKDIIAENE
ncbi:hypothetical protein GCM10027035_23080 [Emticicia sediminis]